MRGATLPYWCKSALLTPRARTRTSLARAAPTILSLFVPRNCPACMAFRCPMMLRARCLSFVHFRLSSLRSTYIPPARARTRATAPSGAGTMRMRWPRGECAGRAGGSRWRPVPRRRKGGSGPGGASAGGWTEWRGWGQGRRPEQAHHRTIGRLARPVRPSKSKP